MSGTMRVITGSMFSGKSQVLANWVERSLIADRNIAIIFPEMANRQSWRDLPARLAHWNDRLLRCPMPTDFHGWREFDISQLDAIAIDEAQFFSPEIVHVVKAWRSSGLTVWVAGLDLDFRGRPFGSMGDLLCLADAVEKVHAVCMGCKQADASVSYLRKRNDDFTIIHVGDHEYEPLCWDCFEQQTHTEDDPERGSSDP